jgi:NAD(P)H-hydrate epimerase
MARLDPGSGQRARAATIQAFTDRWPHTLLLKGARTLVGQRSQPISYNPTGSPGMATGGMGDVLTGVCAALAGHGLPLYDVARLAAWLCGRAAELAIFEGDESEESLCASSLVGWLGDAFQQLRAKCY